MPDPVRILIVEDDPDTAAAIAALRARGSQALILVLSALGRAAQRVEGLDRGADDYLAKPCEPGELRARLRALLRRATMQGADNDLLALGTVVIRIKARTVHVGQTHVPVRSANLTSSHSSPATRATW